ncbi:hypothetical protein DS2_05415 [Catenovulum agarivorans DS-2]|uniref:UDP-N-acetyl-alpha-D-muramoyl-L-alanyl-L-glutamate epimerase n=1 Tax=Catenovulum agarivorans DS-2 TaxID=1328313 RepID=W7QGD5_9ALTE|nr:hypothetical protein [Catenovulum agarivorans]EWH10981.1 hypothetical protein DS2_05415 [Catenovulum agarivorans DS-2]
MLFQQFSFENYQYLAEQQQIILNYRADDYQFAETLTFDFAQQSFPVLDDNIDKLLNYLLIAAGVSYFKLSPYAQVQHDTIPLSTLAQQFFTQLYRLGLAEFAYRNKLDLSHKCCFGTADKNVSKPRAEKKRSRAVTQQHKALVLVGGGKDSLVSIEALKKQDVEVILFAVNPAQPIIDCAKAAGLPLIQVKRQLDEQLFYLNEQGGLNGHVPITAIISFIASFVAIALGCDYVVTSNEASANEATVVHNGIEVNHQYSKSLAFERDFSQLLASELSVPFRYFSLLRQQTEMRIVQQFCQTDKYDTVFTSCNKAFKLREKKSDQRWCLACPKCQFVHLMFAVTDISEQRMMAIFSGNPLLNIDFIPDYQSLVGLTAEKPWECVGEKLESAVAIYLLSKRTNTKNWPVVKNLAPQVIQNYGEQHLQQSAIELMALRDSHFIPEQWAHIFA